MLKKSKNITITAQSVIKDAEQREIQVANMNASVSTDGSRSINMNKNILDQELYAANRTEVRADMDEFEQAVYAVEDEVLGGTPSV